MKRFWVTAALALSALAGTATAAPPAGVIAFSATPAVSAATPVPNKPGSVFVSPNFTQPPAVPETLAPQALLALWQRAGAAYGIEWQVLAAINKVESNFGRNMGPSSAGAIGWMQFMPSTWLRWGVDANGDGIADPWNPADAVYSAARYLAAAGGAQNIAQGVFAYNHAQWYVDEVLQLANLYGAGGATGASTTFSLDQMQQSLSAARKAVVRANRTAIAASAVARRLNRAENRLLARESSATLLSDRLAWQQRAVLLDVRRTSAVAAAERALSDLQAARSALAQAEARSQQAAFAPAAGQLLAAPSFAGAYVFPVGGGPNLVSAGQSHHDYPAVDIAAPEGSPVYALANAVVVNSWSKADPRCGIGMTLRTGDGLVWTYCHLAYLDPTVVPGATLAGGQSVGLVGHTGDATGPHLHLQLQPATQWPQRLGWFQAFAGRAFAWQGAPNQRALASVGGGTQGSVFAVVPAAAALAGPVFAVLPAPGSGQVIAFTR